MHAERAAAAVPADSADMGGREAAVGALGPAAVTLFALGLGSVGYAARGGDKFVPVNVPDGSEAYACWTDRGAGASSARTCCPADEDPCSTGGDALNALITSGAGALLLPLLPWLLHVGTAGRLSRCGQAGSADRHRLALTASILLARAVVLYGVLGAVEDAVQPPEGTGNATGTSCWYAAMRREERCGEGFNFSDHVVLFSVSFLAPLGLEGYACAMSPHGGKQAVVGLVVAAVAYTAVVLFCMVRTVAFFHTPSESLVGWLLSYTFVHLPLFLALRHSSQPGSSPEGGADARVFSVASSWLHDLVVVPPAAGESEERMTGEGQATTITIAAEGTPLGGDKSV